LNPLHKEYPSYPLVAKEMVVIPSDCNNVLKRSRIASSSSTINTERFAISPGSHEILISLGRYAEENLGSSMINSVSFSGML
jgi:hypothetical protein